MTTYTLSGGCFWCLDGVFAQLRGIETIISGYTGGTAEDADYYRVAYGHTDHVETVQVIFDESVLPGNVLLDIFFTLHNPTTLNRQGADHGSQYASVMWYADDTQKAEFETARDRAQHVWDDPIVTRIEPLKTFYPGETDQQNFNENNPTSPYCQIVIDPKISKVRQSFKEYFK